jgi:glycosyltransferase involved in cell wall biosynthesis
MRMSASMCDDKDDLYSHVRQLPLPMFVLSRTSSTESGTFYYFTEKLLYDTNLRAWAVPVLSSLFRRRGHVHLFQNAGDLGHRGHFARTQRGIVEYALLEHSVCAVLVCDPDDLVRVKAIRRAIGAETGHLPGTLFHHNRLADPNVFRLVKEPRYPWAHVARLVEEKQHELLLAALDLLRNRRPDLLGGVVLSSGEGERAAYATRVTRGYTRLGAVVERRAARDRVASLLVSCRMGLSLSLAEGDCRAVGEYLLAGLPVLSIDGARGGKNLYLDESNSALVDPTPEAVAEGITRLVDQPWRSAMIRSRYARACLPGSYEELRKIGAEAAGARGLLLGAPTQSPVHYLMRGASLYAAGFSRTEVESVCDEIVSRYVCVRLASVSGPEAGSRSVRFLIRGAGDDHATAVDLAVFGLALVPPDSELTLRIGDESINLKNSCTFHVDGLRVDVSRPRPPALGDSNAPALRIRAQR